MLRSSIYSVGVVLLGTTILAQRDLSNRLHLKSQVKDGGIYHVGMGTWTRAGALNTQLGPTFRTIYNNTCTSPFFGAIYPGETWTDEGRVPTINSIDKLFDPSQASVAAFVGTTNQCPRGPSSAPGTAKGSKGTEKEAPPGPLGMYTIDAFTIGYCSDQNGALSVPVGTGANITVDFRESTPLDAFRCAQSPLVAPTPNASFSLISFPGRGANPFTCWLVALDLTGVSASFTMLGDGNGNYANPVRSWEGAHCFSWSFSFPTIASPTSTAASGFILAGNPNNSAGGWASGSTTGGGTASACSGYDGTVWDQQKANAAPLFAANGVISNANGAQGTLTSVAFAGEAGTGMTTQDSMRIDVSPATSFNGCYFFGGPGGGNPFSSFHLKLHTLENVTVIPPVELQSGTGFCFGDGCAFTCPCAAPNVVPNPQGGHDSGCANSFTQGVELEVQFVSFIPFKIQFEAEKGAFGFAFLVKGNAKTPNGLFPATSDGVRCASGALVRFGGHNFGSNGAAAQEWSYPNTAQTTAVDVATAQVAGQLAYYQLFYRNPSANFCSTATTNFSHGIIVQW